MSDIQGGLSKIKNFMKDIFSITTEWRRAFAQNRLGNMPHIPSPKEEDRSHSQPHKAGVGAAPPHTSSPSSFLLAPLKRRRPLKWVRGIFLDG